jgi:hypothetical protein
VFDEAGNVLIDCKATLFRHLHHWSTIEARKWAYHFLFIEDSVTDNFDEQEIIKSLKRGKARF